MLANLGCNANLGLRTVVGIAMMDHTASLGSPYRIRQVACAAFCLLHVPGILISDPISWVLCHDGGNGKVLGRGKVGPCACPWCPH